MLMHNNQRSTNFLKQVRCAVLDTSHSINDKEISTYMKQITYNFLRNNYSHYKFKIYEGNSVDRILYDIRKDPGEEDISLVVIQAYGNVLYDTWKPLEHGYSLFREYCNNEWIDMADANKFLVMGHILDERESKDRWFRLHEQCFVINYKMWKQLGYPKFGGYETDPVEVREAVRSTENIHDEHTPTYLAPGTETITITKKGFGWNFINESLKSGLAVLNFDEQARKTKTYLYPEIKEDQKEFKQFFREDCANFKPNESKLGQTKKEFLEYQSYTVQRSPEAIWVMNTESVNDVIFVPRKYPLKNLYSVAAGFKTFAFLKNWNRDTVVEDVMRSCCPRPGSATPAVATATRSRRAASWAPRWTSTRPTRGAWRSSSGWCASRRPSRARCCRAPRSRRRWRTWSRRRSTDWSAPTRCRPGCRRRATAPSRSWGAPTSTSPSRCAPSSAASPPRRRAGSTTRRRATTSPGRAGCGGACRRASPSSTRGAS